MLLAADVGGTKTNIALYEMPIKGSDGVPVLLQEATLPSGQFRSLEALTYTFLTSIQRLNYPRINQAVFGVPGPVMGGQAQTTNLPWSVDANSLERALRAPSVTLLNDLEATAYGIRHLPQTAFYTLQEGTHDAGTIAVIAPGTGLGQAFMTHHGRRDVACASEGGHADFAPNDVLQLELLHYLLERFEHVSLERVCSGRGLPNLYAFLKDRRYAVPSLNVVTALAAATEPTPVILSAAVNRECPLCERTLELFLDILAAAASSLALTVLATRGVFLGGGILPRIVPAINNDRFIRKFQQKGRLQRFVSNIPVSIILEPKTALFGAACYSLERTSLA